MNVTRTRTCATLLLVLASPMCLAATTGTVVCEAPPTSCNGDVAQCPPNSPGPNTYTCLPHDVPPTPSDLICSTNGGGTSYICEAYPQDSGTVLRYNWIATGVTVTLIDPTHTDNTPMVQVDCTTFNKGDIGVTISNGTASVTLHKTLTCENYYLEGPPVDNGDIPIY